MLELTATTTSDRPADDIVTLPFELRQKSRQRLRLDSGREAALLLPPGTTLDDGSLVVADDGTTVVVRAAIEEVSVVRGNDAHSLARACYHLGNRHVALQIGDGWLRYQPDHVLDDMVRGLGLEVRREQAPFQPERGAYHSHAAPHAHSHGDDRGHVHVHAHHD